VLFLNWDTFGILFHRIPCNELQKGALLCPRAVVQAFLPKKAEGTKKPQQVLRLKRVTGLALSSQPLVIYPGVALKLSDRNQHARSYSANMQFAIGEQVVQAALADGQILCRVAAIYK
jgi:hypothetical protein